MLADSSLQVEGPQAPVDMESDDICWICLDGTKDRDPLINPCRCPRKVHPRCLARWQLQQAGRLEETNCRFCQSNLADWKASLTPENLKPDVQRVQPIMVVYFEGQIHRIPVKQGPDGLKEFTHRIRELFRLPDDVDISLTFGCKEPLSGQHLKLEGIGAFDAAVHCASVAAAERQQKLKSGGGVATSGGSGAGAEPATGAATGGNAGIADSPVGAAAGAAAAMRPASADPDYTMHRHSHFSHDHNYHNHLNRAASTAAGIASAPSSTPVSAQTSAGGADSVTGGSGLHAAASAPVLTHYASDSNLLATAAATATDAHGLLQPSSPGLGPESSLQGCVSLPEQPASGRSSSGGGAATASGQGAHLQRQEQGFGSVAAAAATAMRTAFSHPALVQRAASGGSPSTSPFHAAATASALGVGYGNGPAAGVEQLPHRRQQTVEELYLLQQQQRRALQQQQQQRRHQQCSMPPPLYSQFTLPLTHTTLQQESTLAGCLSEPFTAGGSRPSSAPHATTPSSGSPFATAPSPLSSCRQEASSPPSTPPQPQPTELAGSGFPYSTALTSPYAAPLLPPLLTPTSSGSSSAPHLRRGSDHTLEQRPVSPSLSPSPSLVAAAANAAAVPLTPRDHYVACREADGRSDTVSAMSHTPYTYPQRHQRQPSLTSGYLALKLQQEQQSAVAQENGVRPAAAAVATPTAAAAAAAAAASTVCADDGSSVTCSSALSTAIADAGNAVGPTTPSHPVARRTNTPTSAPRLPAAVLIPSSSISLSPTVSSNRHHPYLGSAVDADDVAVAAPLQRMLAAGGCTTAIPACDDGHRTIRRTTVSRTEYDMATTLPCSAADDSAALGSLTGRLKFSLRAFSRKVARSLNFQRGGTGHGTGCGAIHAVSTGSGLMTSVVEADGAAAAAAADAEALLPAADAEAEVEEVTEPPSPAAAAAASVANAAGAIVAAAAAPTVGADAAGR